MDFKCVTFEQGFVLLFCYILHNETPLQLRPITSLHLDDTPDTGEYSENDVNPLNSEYAIS